MLQADEPEDFVMATGETHSVRESVEIAFARAGPRPRRVRRDRPASTTARRRWSAPRRRGKAKKQLGWEPKVRFKELVELMVDADVEALEDQLAGKVTRFSHEGA